MAPTCVLIHPLSYPPPSPSTTNNPLPQFLHTPTGLAILELQGTLNIEHHTPSNDTDPPLEPPPSPITNETLETPIGTLSFPSEAFTLDLTEGEGKNKKRKIPVHLFVGKYQRLRGEVRLLDKPLGVLRKRHKRHRTVSTSLEEKVEEGEEEELEVMEIIRWKIVFSSRPEPVNGG